MCGWLNFGFFLKCPRIVQIYELILMHWRNHQCDSHTKLWQIINDDNNGGDNDEIIHNGNSYGDDNGDADADADAEDDDDDDDYV